MVEGAGSWQLRQLPLDHSMAQNVFIDAHLHVDLTESFRAEGKIELPNVCLQQQQQPSAAVAAVRTTSALS